MRLHQLSVSAFGPFAGTEQIDFAELNESGLFLLTGPTGAGKTSVLDAISFALYGTVPGVRGTKTLKSHHASAETRPEVVLDFSIQDRRFRVHRSPSWSRPKRRGTGLKTEAASASLLETSSGQERFLSSRAQEVGHLITSLVGMNADQFSQVALLPQGEFARFLQAGSQERHDVLQQLFRTDRFAKIETWVNDHSKELRDSSLDEERTTQRIVDLMAGRAGAAVPEELEGTALAAAASDGRLVAWASALTEDARCRVTTADREHRSARADAERLRVRHTEVTRLHERGHRRAEAERWLAELASGAADAALAERELDEDARSSRCQALLRGLDEATDRQETALARREQHRADLASLVGVSPDEITSTFVGERVRLARSTLDRIETLMPRERARDQAREVIASAEPQLRALTERIAGTTRRRDRIPVERDTARADLTSAVQTAHRREGLTSELAALRIQLTAAGQLPAARARLVEVQASLRAATDHAQSARARMQEVVARRLAEMAAELAGRLEDGQACMVCGALEHPEPAAPSADPVTEQQQEEATLADDASGAARDRSQRKVAEAEKQVVVLEQAAAGVEVAEGAAREERINAGLEAASAAEGEIRRLEESLAGLEAELDATVRTLRDDEAERAALEHDCRTAHRVIDDVAGEIAAVLPESDAHSSLVELEQRERSLLTALEAARTAFTDFDAARARVDEETDRALAAAAEAGFESVEAARRACLSAARRELHRTLLQQRIELQARAEGVLDDGEDAAELTDPVDLASLGAELDEALAAAESAARVLHEQESVADSLGRSLERLELSVGSWSPVREKYLRAEAMANLVRGMGGDNHRQVRLSAYVLAARLDQVVDAANERLALMRDQRYLLERTGRSARKGSQSGLGLDILDEWTGEVRDPATLSGGETFVVSLSLALGLADVVTHEVGGVEIETLFVDEGFGSLDPDTLDDVMDRIDSLRDGGRTVGLVSHVSELRNRIPTQLHVDKQRTGSTISVRTLIA